MLQQKIDWKVRIEPQHHDVSTESVFIGFGVAVAIDREEAYRNAITFSLPHILLEGWPRQAIDVSLSFSTRLMKLSLLRSRTT